MEWVKDLSEILEGRDSVSSIIILVILAGTAVMLALILKKVGGSNGTKPPVGSDVNNLSQKDIIRKIWEQGDKNAERLARIETNQGIAMEKLDNMENRVSRLERRGKV